MDIGSGLPKIVVSTTRSLHENIEDAFDDFNRYRNDFDVLEIRADYFDEMQDDEHTAVVNKIAERFSKCPVIYTYRSQREGGEGGRSVAEYLKLLKQVIKHCNIDFLDIEYLTGEDIVKELSAEAKENGIKVLLSNHNFKETPPLEEMQKLLYRMNTVGGDILKVAYQPGSVEDTLNVLNVVHKAKSALGNKVIGISMGEKGTVTRLAGGTFGSCMTYGYVAETAAPGQIHASKICEALKAYTP